MCYLVTGINPGFNAASISRAYVIYDTEPEAKEQAENYVRAGYSEVAVWKQIATPKAQTIINWEPSNEPTA